MLQHFLGYLVTDPLPAEQRALAVAHLGRVGDCLERIDRNVAAEVDRGKLFEAGLLGLLDAVRDFPAAPAVSFGTYANYRIRAAMLDSLRPAGEQHA